MYITASVGASLFPGDGGDAHTLLRNAGAGFSQAKRNGTRVEFFDRRMRDETMRRLLVENELRHALARGELAVHYQPKIANVSGMITGFEPSRAGIIRRGISNLPSSYPSPRQRAPFTSSANGF